MPTDQNLIGSEGLPLWGRLLHLPHDINWRSFDARNAMGRKRHNLEKQFLFKHFDFYGVQSEGLTFGCGIVRLGLLNSVFAYIDGPHTGFHHQQFNFPLDTGLEIDTRPLGHTRWQHPLKSDFRIDSERTDTARRLTMNFGHCFRALVDIHTTEPLTLALCTPVANTGFTYAQKSTGCSVSGEITLNGQTFALNPDLDGCYHDWTAGYLRRETFWNWCCVTGRRAAHEPLLAINVARGVNETSAHENELWVDGHRHELPLCHFKYDRDQVMQPWQVYSDCGAVDLTFEPVGQIQDHRNLWILASRFNQCFGVFKGAVRNPATGQMLRVDGLKGWCEDHYAKW